jgi:periplasmic protein TonB
MQANTNLPTYELKSELARVSLHATDRDRSRKLAWVNSICILFLFVGIIGSKPATVSLRPLPPLEEAVPAIIEPLSPPPPTTTEERQQEPSDNEKPDTPQVVVVTPDAPNINFAVPTIGNVVVPSAIAKPPPLNPMRAPAPLKQAPATLNSTGSGGERPQPPYPKIALEQGQHGTVILSLSADEAGIITSVEVKQSSGFPILDRSAVDFVKRHWTVPPGTRLAEVPINYRLKAD